MRNSYGDFSKYYDRLGWNRFARICAVRLRWFFRLRGEKPQTILNLACGTAELEKLLSKTGIIFTGVDISIGMLAEARRKCPQFEFVLGDAAKVRLGKRFDMVLLLYDSANHMNSLPHLIRVFKNARRYLKNDGYFIFDINTPIGLKKWDKVNIRRSKEFTVIVSSSYNPDKLSSNVLIEAFVKRGKSYKRVVQKVVERAYPHSDIIDGLIKSGFEKIVASPFDVSQEIEGAGRLWFVCS